LIGNNLRRAFLYCDVSNVNVCKQWDEIHKVDCMFLNKIILTFYEQSFSGKNTFETSSYVSLNDKCNVHRTF